MPPEQHLDDYRASRFHHGVTASVCTPLGRREHLLRNGVRHAQESLDPPTRLTSRGAHFTAAAMGHEVGHPGGVHRTGRASAGITLRRRIPDAMRPKVLALAAAAAVVAAVMPAHAGTQKAQITDPAGDANGINSQPTLGDNGIPNPNAATAPASYSADDIVSVSFVNNFVTKKVKRKTVKSLASFTVKMILSAAPDPAHSYYAVTATSADCPDGITFEYSTQPSIFAFDDVQCY